MSDAVKLTPATALNVGRWRMPPRRVMTSSRTPSGRLMM